MNKQLHSNWNFNPVHIGFFSIGLGILVGCTSIRSSTHTREIIPTCECRQSALVVFGKTESQIKQDLQEIKIRHLDDSVSNEIPSEIYNITIDSLSGAIQSVELENSSTEKTPVIRDIMDYIIELGPFLCIGTKNNGDKVNQYDLLIQERMGDILITMGMGVRWW